MNNTNTYDLYLKGSRDELEFLCREVALEFPTDEINMGNVKPYQPNLLDRDPLRQVEIFDVLIKIGESVAARAIYDFIIGCIKSRAKYKEVKLEEIQIPSKEKDKIED